MIGRNLKAEVEILTEAELFRISLARNREIANQLVCTMMLSSTGTWRPRQIVDHDAY